HTRRARDSARPASNRDRWMRPADRRLARYVSSAWTEPPRIDRNDNAPGFVCAMNRVFFLRRCAGSRMTSIRTSNFRASGPLANLHAGLNRRLAAEREMTVNAVIQPAAANLRQELS